MDNCTRKHVKSVKRRERKKRAIQKAASDKSAVNVKHQQHIIKHAVRLQKKARQLVHTELANRKKGIAVDPKKFEESRSRFKHAIRKLDELNLLLGRPVVERDFFIVYHDVVFNRKTFLRK